MRTDQTLKAGGLLLALPLIAAACTEHAAKTEQTAAMSPGEQACAAQAAQSAGVDPTTVAVTKTTTSTNGASVFVAKTATHSYMCVIEPDQRMSTFEQQK